MTSAEMALILDEIRDYLILDRDCLHESLTDRFGEFADPDDEQAVIDCDIRICRLESVIAALRGESGDD